MLKSEVRKYLIEFLIGEIYAERGGMRHSLSASWVGYTQDPEEMKHYSIVIYPSGFFSAEIYGSHRSEPTTPLAQWRGIPLLFGSPREELSTDGKTLVIYADVIASSYYLLSRYEEIYRRSERDEYGRFLGQSALPYRAGFVHRPIVDEYGRALRSIISELGLLERRGAVWNERLPYFSKVHLLYNLRHPYHCRGLWGACRAVVREHEYPWRALSKAYGHPTRDDYYTFGRIIDWTTKLQTSLPELVDATLFIRGGGAHPLDGEGYRLTGRYMRTILAQWRRAGLHFGLYASYRAGQEVACLTEEKHRLEAMLSEQIHSLSGHHLSGGEPEDMLERYRTGFRHDYSMGYADVAGFRLGTARPVRFINPSVRMLTSLVLHPLLLSDYTLTAPGAMGLGLREAESYAEKLIRVSAEHGGELNILWHTELFSTKAHPWLATLYRGILHYVSEVECYDPRLLTPEEANLRATIVAHGCSEIHI